MKWKNSVRCLKTLQKVKSVVFKRNAQNNTILGTKSGSAGGNGVEEAVRLDHIATAVGDILDNHSTIGETEELYLFLVSPLSPLVPTCLR